MSSKLSTQLRTLKGISDSRDTKNPKLIPFSWFTSNIRLFCFSFNCVFSLLRGADASALFDCLGTKSKVNEQNKNTATAKIVQVSFFECWGRGRSLFFSVSLFVFIVFFVLSINVIRIEACTFVNLKDIPIQYRDMSEISFFFLLLFKSLTSGVIFPTHRTPF